jgi:hypothetical protein
MDTASHKEPLVGPVLGINLLVVYREAEAEEYGGRGVVRMGTQRRVIWGCEPRRDRKDDPCYGLGIQALDSMLVCKGESGRAAGLDKEHDGHITASALLAIPRLASLRRAIHGGSRSGHYRGNSLDIQGTPFDRFLRDVRLAFQQIRVGGKRPREVKNERE